MMNVESTVAVTETSTFTDTRTEREQLMDVISDTYKEVNGFRPRPNWSELSTQQLREWNDELVVQIRQEIRREVLERRLGRKLRRAAQRAWVQKKQTYFVPKTFTLGMVIGI